MLKNNKKPSKGEGSPLIRGGIAALVCATLLTLLSAIVITAADVSDSVIRMLGCLVLAVSCLLGGGICAKHSGVNGLKFGALIGGIVFLSVTLVGVILNGIQMHSIIFVKGLLCLLFGIIGGIWGVNSSAKRKLK